MSGINTLSEYVKEKWMNYWGWSASRQNLWDTCPKAYYYQYIHLWKLSWKEKDKFKILKNLQTAPLIHGTHISDILRKLLNKETLPDTEGLSELFEKEMKETFGKGKERVTELYNGLSVSREYFEKHIEAGKKEIGYFIAEIYPLIKDMKIEIVDKSDKYTLEGRTFYSAPDFLGIDDKGYWHLMDWKSGKGEEITESFLNMQLTSYALYAITARGGRPDRMKLYAVFLQTPSKSVEKYLTEEMLESAKNRMFKMHDDILEKSINGPFPALPEERKCKFCNFATICDEGKYFLGL